MPNAIKYSASAQTLALKKGNFWIGTGDVGKGPTSSTEYYNGITPPSGGYTIYLNKASGGPSIYTVTTEAQLTGLTNTLSVSTNLIKNNNGGNFADGTRAPFNYPYPAQTFPTVFDVSNDKPYVGSSTKYALKFTSGLGVAIYSEPSPFTMTAGIVYTFSFWYKQTNSNQGYIQFYNQGGSGDINGNFYAASDTGNFPNPTQTWQRCSWTITNVINKVYLIMTTFNSAANAEILMTEFTLTEGSMPGGPGLTTSGNCLNWFTTQTDKMIFNRDYESIVTSGLTLNLDAGFSPSFATIPSNANSSTVTPWYDLSGNGNDATLTNGPTFSSDVGGNIVFDGSDDLVNCGNILDYTSQNFSFNVWFKITNMNPSGRSGAGNYLFSKGFDYQNGYLCRITPAGAARFGTSQSGAGQYSGTDNGFVTANTWCNICFTRNGSTILAYFNGVNSTGESDPHTNPASASTNLNIGLNNGTNWYMFGATAIFMSYNRALSATEVLQNYNAQKGRFGL